MTNKELSKIESDAAQRIQESKNYYESSLEKSYKYQWNLYNSVRKKTNAAAWRSNNFIPVVFPDVQTEMARFMDGLFGPDCTNFFKLNAKQLKDEDSSEVITAIQNAHMQEAEFYTVGYTASLNAHIFGIGWIIQTWDSHEEKYEYFKTTGTENKKVIVERTYDRPKWSAPSTMDVWFDPNAGPSRSSLGYITVREYMRPSELKVVQHQWNIKKNFHDVINEANSKNKDSLDKDAPLEVLTVYAKEDWTTTINGKAIRYEANPLAHHNIPAYPIVRYPDFYRFGGKGVAAILADLQESTNDIWNLTLDNWKISVNKLFAKRRDAIIPASNLVFEPGKIMSLEDVDRDFKIFDMPGISGDSFKMMDMVQGFVNQTTGSLDYLNSPTGIGTQNKTAAGARIIVQEANRRFAMAIKYNKAFFLLPMLKDLLAIYRQYINRTKVESVLGESTIKAFKIKPKKVNWDGEYDYTITGNPSLLDKQATLDNIKEGLPLLTELGFQINKDAIAAQILDALDLPKDIIMEQPKENNPKAADAVVPAGAVKPGAVPEEAPPASGAPSVPTPPTANNPASALSPQDEQALTIIAQVLGTTPDVLKEDLSTGKVTMDVLKAMAVKAHQQGQKQ